MNGLWYHPIEKPGQEGPDYVVYENGLLIGDILWLWRDQEYQWDQKHDHLLSGDTLGLIAKKIKELNREQKANGGKSSGRIIERSSK